MYIPSKFKLLTHNSGNVTFKIIFEILWSDYLEFEGDGQYYRITDYGIFKGGVSDGIIVGTPSEGLILSSYYIGYGTTMGYSSDTYEVVKASDPSTTVFYDSGEVFDMKYTTLPPLTNNSDYYIFKCRLKD